MPLGQMVVNYGNVQDTFVLSVSLTPVAVGATSTVEQSFTVPGLLVGDQISEFSLQAAYTVNVAAVNVRVTANNTLTVAYQNSTLGSLTPPAGTYYLEVNRLAQLPAPSSIQ